MKPTQLITNLLIVGAISLLFCCNGSKHLTSEIPEPEINYIPYYLKVYEADSLYLTGNYERSFEILDSLFKRFEPLNQISIYEMQTYVKAAYVTKRYDVIKPTFKKLIDTWGFEPSSLEYDSILQSAWQYTKISEDESSQWLSDYKTKINWTLRDTLIQMVKDDQLYRGKDRGKKIMREDSVDLVHIDLLKDIFNKYGYPDFRLVGNPKRGEGVYLKGVFNHISDNLNEEEYQYFQDKLLRFIKEGKASPGNLASLVDRKEFDTKNNSIYGNLHVPSIIYDTIKINQNRKSIGLPSMQYQKFKNDLFQK